MPTGTALGCLHRPPTRMLSASTMTAQRQERNGWRPGIAFIAPMASPVWANLAWVSLVCVSLVWIGLGALAWLPSVARAATTERVIVNRFSGLAIEGFDPVA